MKTLNLASLVAWIALVLLMANTTAAPVIQFSTERIEFTENPDLDLPHGRVWIPTEANIEVQGALVYRVRVVGGTATAAADFELQDQVPWQQRYRTSGIQIDVFDDGIPEPDETVELELQIVSGNAVLGARSRTQVIIRNRPSGFEIRRIEDPKFPHSLMEPVITLPEGPDTCLEIRRTGDRHESVTLLVSFSPTEQLEVSDWFNSAVEGRDFVAHTSQVEFLPGEQVRKVSVPILDNAEVNRDYPKRKIVSARVHGPAVELSALLAIEDNERPAIVDVTYDPYRQPLLLLEHFSTNWGRLTVHRKAMTQLPLPGGKSLLTASGRFGTFTHVNGTPTPGFAVLDANDELDSSFAPNDTREELPQSRFPLYTKGLPLARATDWNLLQDGGLLGPTDSGRLRRLLSTGAEDETFRPPFREGFVHVAESSTGEFWAFRSNAVHRLAANGDLLASHELPALATNGVEVLAVQRDGRLLVRQIDDQAEWQSRESLYRLRLDGTIDPTFRLLRSRGIALGILPDTRLVTSGDDFLRLLNADGSAVAGFPVVELFSSGAGWSGPVFLDGSRVLPGVEAVMGMFGVHAVLLDHFPRNALHATSEVRRGPGAWVELGTGSNGRTNFPIVFRRLGPTDAPATVHFTTRDLTARAGRDYVAQNGVIEFAPLESENRTVSIPILAPPGQQNGQCFEVVVTSAEGFEALPAPLRLFIQDWSNPDASPPPHLDQIKRLRDGRVLLGGTGPQNTIRLEFSPDLKTWHPLTNLLGGFTGESATWLDASATNAATRYYRAVAR